MTATTTRDPGELSAELADITAAQSGDKSAAARLFARYRPLIRATAGRAARARGMQPADREDLEADLTIVLLESIQAHDVTTGRGLAAVLPLRFKGVVSDFDTVVSIPRATLNRYYAALKDAEGVVSVAANLAPEHGMTRETFIATHSALRTSPEATAELVAWGGEARPVPTEPQAAQVDRALAVLTDIQREVIERAYGFRQMGGRSDDWVAEEMGRSKSYIRKVRETALTKMRAELATTLALEGAAA